MKKNCQGCVKYFEWGPISETVVVSDKELGEGKTKKGEKQICKYERPRGEKNSRSAEGRVVVGSDFYYSYGIARVLAVVNRLI